MEIYFKEAIRPWGYPPVGASLWGLSLWGYPPEGGIVGPFWLFFYELVLDNNFETKYTDFEKHIKSIKKHISKVLKVLQVLRSEGARGVRGRLEGLEGLEVLRVLKVLRSWGQNPFNLQPLHPWEHQVTKTPSTFNPFNHLFKLIESSKFKKPILVETLQR